MGISQSKGSRQAKGISRAQFLAGAATVGAAGVAGPAGQARAAQARRGRGLRRRGVVSTVGAGKTPGTAWSARRMRHDIRAIREDLHADTVDVTGGRRRTPHEDRRRGGGARAARLAAADSRGRPAAGHPGAHRRDRPVRGAAAEAGREGRLQRRLRVLALRPRHPAGRDGAGAHRQPPERHGRPGPGMQRRLAEFTVRAAKVGRSVFRGNLGYAAAQSIDAREFISADAPHRPDEPRLDLDMASYALTKVIRDRRPDDPPPAGTGSRRRRSARWPAAMGRRATAPLSRRRGRRRAVRRWPGNGRRPGRRRRCRWPDRRHGRWSSR